MSTHTHQFIISYCREVSILNKGGPITNLSCQILIDSPTLYRRKLNLLRGTTWSANFVIILKQGRKRN